ncbi:MAG: insulinase family protein [Cyclobacteriaceae bacterium]
MKFHYKLFLPLLFIVTSVSAQELNINDLTKEIPVDPKVRVGQLENGLTYYIRYNQKPENKVELRLAVNAGSLMEDDDQLGLAHFTEHMAFNGSEHFEKNELLDYVQSVGVKFGAHINAYTSFDETVYMLPIASDSAEILENAFLILEDWADGLSFEHEEIDKERGVVIEEWRLGQGAQRRMLDQWLPVLLKGSKYAERLPIGTKEILENFKYDVIKRFYNDWYRPNLMSVIVVGDIDLDAMEQKIKDHFSDIENPETLREKKFHPVPDHDNTEVAIVSDKEAPFTNVMIINKYDPEPFITLNDFRGYLMAQIYTGMLNIRLSELVQQSDPPFIFASTSAGDSFVRNKHAFQTFAAVKETDIEKGLTALQTENERVARHGFTKGEFERYKKDMLRSYEIAYNERDKSESAGFANEYVNHFLTQEPIPGIEFEYGFVKQHLDGISIDEINALSNKWLTDENRVVVVMAPEKEGVVLPTEEAVLKIINDLEQTEIDPYEDEEISSELISELPEAGSISEEEIIENIEVTKLTLSNGVQVYLKPTDFKNDEIIMTAYSLGGHSLVSDEKYISASNISSIINLSGVGEFSNVDLQKALAGKSVSVSPYVRELTEGMTGGSTPADLETMFQLIHLYFTAPRRDEEAFNSFVNRNKAVLANVMANPQYYFQDKMARFMSQDHPRGGGIPTVEEFDEIKLDEVLEVYNERFGDASDFTFIFTGNFEVDQIKELSKTYLASLPSSNREETWKDVGIRPPSGKIEKEIKRGADPKSTVILRFTNGIEYDRKDAFLFDKLADLMDIKLVEKLREDESGVYGVGASGSFNRWPYEYFNFQIQFPCGPDNVESLTEAALSEVKKVQDEGPLEEDLAKVREQYRRDVEEGYKKNGWWSSVLRRYTLYNLEFDDFYNLKERVESINAENIQRVAKQYLDTKKYIRVVHNPE